MPLDFDDHTVVIETDGPLGGGPPDRSDAKTRGISPIKAARAFGSPKNAVL